MKRRVGLAELRLVMWALLSIAHLSSAFSLPSYGLRDRTIQRRQKQEPEKQEIPKAVSIGPSQNWDGIDGPWSSFPLQVGTGSDGGLQDVRVMISTASTTIWTIGPEGCIPGYPADCSETRSLFLRNESLTWLAESLYTTGLEENLGMESSGYVGYDTATLGWQGSTTVTNEHSIIFNIADSQYWNGIFGLNPRPSNLTSFENQQISFMQSIFQNQAMPSLSYGYTAGNQYRLNGVFGSLTLGGYDASRFVPNDISFHFYEDISRDLLINLHGITTDNTTPANLLPGGSIPIFIDSTVAEIWLPASACRAFEDAFGIEFNDNFKRYIITADQREQLLDQNAQVTFTIGNETNGGGTVDITLPYSAFDLQVHYPIVLDPNVSYYFPLQQATNETQYTLGRTFLQEAYLFADYEHQNFSVSACNWDGQNGLEQQLVSVISPYWRNATSDDGDDPFFSTAEIAGIGVGSIGVIAILSFALFILRRKRLQEKRRLAEQESEAAEKASKTASSSSDESRNPYISYPIGGELGGGDVHEMNGAQRLYEVDGSYRPTDFGQHGYSEMTGGEYYASGKYYRYSATEMDTSTPIYEMHGSVPSDASGSTPTYKTSGGSDPSEASGSTPEQRPEVPPK